VGHRLEESPGARTNRQSFMVSPSSRIYTGLAGTCAIPAVIGIVLGIVLGLIPGKKGSA
jgi:hypothetical protein